jgi:S-methylmethionine-dependent homocysteine/selenocysteine methylase
VPLRDVVSLPNALVARLDAGLPLVIGGDAASGIIARGVHLEGTAPLGRLVREHPEVVTDYYGHELTAGVDVVLALTDETMPRALGQIGMAFRSAALTGTAIELALDAVNGATRRAAVAGLLGARWIAPVVAERITEEYAMHATRLSTSGCEVILARGISSEVFPHGASLAHTLRVAAIASACATQLPTWAVLETKDGEHLADGDAVDDAVRGAVEAGVHAVLFDALTESAAKTAMDVALKLGARVGVLLGAAPDARHGVPTKSASTDAWVAGCERLVKGGASIIGGGAGTTLLHLAGLSQVYGKPDIRPAVHSGLAPSQIERQTSSE